MVVRTPNCISKLVYFPFPKRTRHPYNTTTGHIYRDLLNRSRLIKTHPRQSPASHAPAPETCAADSPIPNTSANSRHYQTRASIQSQSHRSLQAQLIYRRRHRDARRTGYLRHADAGRKRSDDLGRGSARCGAAASGDWGWKPRVRQRWPATGK
jgi:hypothetical protein